MMDKKVIDNTIENRRIAKNTILLYFRTIIVMFVSLYTSRVILKVLGVEDYGVYNAVGGFVAMFSIISGSLSNAISRYITVGIGKGDATELQRIFSTSVSIQIIISFLVVLVCELFGVWFLNFKMDIPNERMIAANWVLQCSLIVFVVNLISIPYNACIIAHEHMSALALISILEAVLKLTVVLLISFSSVDKLIIYSVLLAVVAIIVRIIYGIYCKSHFKEVHYGFLYDKSLFKEMMGFSGWNFFSNTASILNTQGLNLLINLFYGVLLNAARGIAAQVESAVMAFVYNFSSAINPQITKSYAVGNKERLHFLICKGAKFTFFLTLLFSLPVLIETNYLLKIWLGHVPDFSVLFTRLALIGALVSNLGNTSYVACLATGKIKKYSIYITSVASSVFFLTWFFYGIGFHPATPYIVFILVYCVVLFVRLYLMKEMLDFPIMLFVRQVIYKIIPPSVLSIILPLLLQMNMAQSLLRCLCVCTLCIVSSSVIIYALGLSCGEKVTVKKTIMEYLEKYKLITVKNDKNNR